MRLLHSSTWTFQEFFDSDGPKYAVLSHRWGSDEVSYRELQRAIKDTKAAAEPKLSGAGFLKIQKFREQAARDEFEWVWVDTCCINKHNGAELSEAINSMYRCDGKRGPGVDPACAHARRDDLAEGALAQGVPEMMRIRGEGGKGPVDIDQAGEGGDSLKGGGSAE